MSKSLRFLLYSFVVASLLVAGGQVWRLYRQHAVDALSSKCKADNEAIKPDRDGWSLVPKLCEPEQLLENERWLIAAGRSGNHNVLLAAIHE